MRILVLILLFVPMCIIAQAPSTAGAMTPTPKKLNHFVFFPVGQHNMAQKEWNYLEQFLGDDSFQLFVDRN